MAVQTEKLLSSIKVKLYLGLDGGKEKTRSKTFSNVKSNASVDDMHEVASTLMALQKHDVVDIIKIDNTVLS